MPPRTGHARAQPTTAHSRAAVRRRTGPGAATLVVVGGLAMVAGVGAAAAMDGRIGLPGAPVAGAADEGVRPVVQDLSSAPEADGLGGAETQDQPDDPGTTDDAPAAGPADLPSAHAAVAVPLDPHAPGPDGLSAADRVAGLTSTAVPTSAGGDLVVVPGSEPAPHPDRPVRSVRVEVEAGLDIDGAAFAATVMRTLNDPRGWGADGSVTFARTDGAADMRVVLASPAKVDAMCAPLRTRGLYSCGRYGHAAINHTRWVQGTEEYVAAADMTLYRHYVVNHEIGHLLGHPHVSCPGEGLPAPIMQQQTIRVAPCTPTGWPYPDGA